MPEITIRSSVRNLKPLVNDGRPIPVGTNGVVVASEFDHFLVKFENVPKPNRFSKVHPVEKTPLTFEGVLSFGPIVDAIANSGSYRTLSDKSGTNEDRVYFFLSGSSAGLIADEAAKMMEDEDQDGKPKVNRVAPVLTGFLESGIVIHPGTRRQTRNGKPARVHLLSADAQEKFVKAYGRAPALTA